MSWILLNSGSSPEVFLWKGVLKMCSKFTGEHPSRNTISMKLQNYWNQTSAWVFSCKFAAYLQNTFFWEHLWRDDSVLSSCSVLSQLSLLKTLHCWNCRIKVIYGSLKINGLVTILVMFFFDPEKVQECRIKL